MPLSSRDAIWHGPNPSLSPSEVPPFYAVRQYLGDTGAAMGYATDEHARVLNAQGKPSAGIRGWRRHAAHHGRRVPGAGHMLGQEWCLAILLCATRWGLRSGAQRSTWPEA